MDSSIYSLICLRLAELLAISILMSSANISSWTLRSYILSYESYAVLLKYS